MSYSRGDYAAMSSIIRETRGRYIGTHGAAAAVDIQAALSAHFKRNNPRFDAERFARDCEPARAEFAR